MFIAIDFNLFANIISWSNIPRKHKNIYFPLLFCSFSFTLAHWYWKALWLNMVWSLRPTPKSKPCSANWWTSFSSLFSYQCSTCAHSKPCFSNWWTKTSSSLFSSYQLPLPPTPNHVMLPGEAVSVHVIPKSTVPRRAIPSSRKIEFGD